MGKEQVRKKSYLQSTQGLGATHLCAISPGGEKSPIHSYLNTSIHPNVCKSEANNFLAATPPPPRKINEKLAGWQPY